MAGAWGLVDGDGFEATLMTQILFVSRRRTICCKQFVLLDLWYIPAGRLQSWRGMPLTQSRSSC